MNIRILFDFHDIFVDSANAWKEVFVRATADNNVIKMYNDRISKKEICKSYNLDYKIIEDEYRKILKPIEKNIEFAENLSKIYPIDIISMSKNTRLLKDIEKFNIKHLFSNIYSKEDIINREDFLKKLSEKYDWILFFNHEINRVVLDEKIIYCPIDFQGDINQFGSNSFTEHAKNKLIYNELSDIYMQSIANDTTEETMFLDNIFKKYNCGDFVLDCCCGVGRHCRALAKKGYKVTGIDISKRQIENAIKNNSVENTNYLNMDVRNIKLEKNDYGAAMCMWTTYNYLSQDGDFLKFIKGVHEHLVNNGILVLDAKNIPALKEKRIYKRENITDDLKLELLICKRIVGNIQNSQYFYFINRNGKNEFFLDEEFVRFYNLNEIDKLINKYFEIVDVFGDFDMREYNKNNSRRFIVVLRKK